MTPEEFKVICAIVFSALVPGIIWILCHIHENNGRKQIEMLNENPKTQQACARAMKDYGIKSNFSNLRCYFRYSVGCCLVDAKYGDVYHLKNHRDVTEHGSRFYIELQFMDEHGVTVINSKYFKFYWLNNDAYGEASIRYFFESYRYRLSHHLTSDAWDKNHFSLVK